MDTVLEDGIGVKDRPKEACSNVKILASIVNFTPLCDECMNEERVAR